MPLPSIYVNGQDVEALGLRLEKITGPWDIPKIADPTVTLPRRAGSLRSGAPRTIAQRTIQLGGKIFEAKGARTNADVLAKIETIKQLFSLGILSIRTTNQPTRAYYVNPPDFQVTMIGPPIVATSADFTATFDCLDPYGYDTNPTLIGFGAAATPLLLGSGASTGLLRIFGPATNPVITYRDVGANALHTIGLTRALTSSDYEEIDLDLLKVTRVQSGVASNDLAALSSGDIESFVLSPEDGDPPNGVGPTLECSGLGAGGGCEATYFRSYV